MQSMVNWKMVTALFCSLNLLACASREEAAPMEINESSQLKGFWLLDSATQDGNPTSTLGGLYLDIKENEITSNFGGDTLTEGYIFDGDKKELRHFIRDTFLYKIGHVNDSVLKMQTVIRDYPFEFVFRRVQQDTI